MISDAMSSKSTTRPRSQSSRSTTRSSIVIACFVGVHFQVTADAFGLDFNFMKVVAKIESGFNPNQRTGSYIGLFQLSEYEFSKFGFGQIRSPRDNAVAAAYKVITEGILFEWITHRKPDLNDLYLIHQQGWEGAAEHISQPDRIAWKSMCATSEGREKGEKWCK